MEYELEQVLQPELGMVYAQQLDMDDQLELEQQQGPIYHKIINEIKLKKFHQMNQTFTGNGICLSTGTGNGCGTGIPILFGPKNPKSPPYPP